eukprot:m.25987 g.25987  ORF g.25987 m.25987 type:complete len:136 (+) comp29042_c0_seq1:329-736(+)
MYKLWTSQFLIADTNIEIGSRETVLEAEGGMVEGGEEDHIVNMIGRIANRIGKSQMKGRKMKNLLTKEGSLNDKVADEDALVPEEGVDINREDGEMVRERKTHGKIDQGEEREGMRKRKRKTMGMTDALTGGGVR